ncbi:DUF1415 domain-containing protein [Colwellia psychrerythraea]|uniref:DUF1415 domain-containing protein n=1 Tax=Colwellia psychrerythraea (strain 34H / ATCC BAA-681) TaxID=167879 RepID=Q47ZU0_COLP3|nr:DUF1415 domain-containing protein [Colwellia psychrerythraea]AAZ26691.1 hypothetical protein CPS_2979 [Colwellia psychrerythraea 34H]
MNKDEEQLTDQQSSVEVDATKQWLDEIIIGLNFCPFAKKEFVNNTICYFKSEAEQVKPALQTVIEQCHYLQKHEEIETTLIIFAEGFRRFDRYLDLVDYANDSLIDSGFEGIFQLATMHPEYCFADDDFDDASNFTNRSPYPMLHIIREASMARVLAVYKDPEKIPEQNMALAEQKGSNYFQDVLKRIHQNHPQK